MSILKLTRTLASMALAGVLLSGCVVHHHPRPVYGYYERPVYVERPVRRHFDGPRWHRGHGHHGHYGHHRGHGRGHGYGHYRHGW